LDDSEIVKRVVKHTLYVLLAAGIAHIFLSYFVSIPALYDMMHHSPLRHTQAFGVVTFLTVALYFCFSWFREQFCVILCPYGRMQSALIDDHSVIIGYDSKRGERTWQGERSDCWSLHQLQPLRAGLPHRHRHSQWLAARMHRLRRLCRCV